jgi:peptide/nickel transport system permease protein
MVEVLESDYIEMARLKGVRGSVTIIRHALPNIAGPASQAIGLALAYLAGGAVVVEYVFAYPGVGQGLVNAVTDRDVPVIQALTLLLAASYVTFNLIADIVTYMLTPRARTSLR